ncbi:WD repeat-containing protein 46 [Ephemerocybe angulata]|uniref:U three protein 7 n=1 Tax=Ephemerocybe angulata TaxID=980116 RepID=A0A8H6M2H3_9AGAR|nr:WD repeat-containing protein 46 [Tulosesus angulatus]
MDALIARADAIRPLSELKAVKTRDSGKGKAKANSKGKSKDTSTSNSDYTLQSISSHANVPKSLAPLDPSSSKSKNDEVPKYNHIANKKLRSQLVHQHALNSNLSKNALETQQNLLSLAADDAGSIQVTGPLEKTWRISQDEIVASVGGEAAKGRRELTFGPGQGAKRMKWSQNGRHLVFISGKGGTKVSSVDWMGGNVNCEVDLLAGSNLAGAGGNGGGGEAARDVTFLQDQSFFAVAQKRNVFVYDRDGVEVHRLNNIIDPLRLDFLPWHWLLVAVTNSGHLSYTDTTTGTQIAVHRTKLGACNTLTQNRHNAVVHLGHQNGCVTLWTPNLPKPAVQILSHMGPVTSISVNPSDGGSAGSVNMPGRYMATAGRDGKIKIWDCRNWKGVVREWAVRGAGDVELEWSQKGYLGVLSGGSVNVYHPPHIVTPYTGSSSSAAPPLYLSHPIPHKPLQCLRFEPFSDVLAIGHNKGLSSILVPGAGEPQFDSLEADPFENAKARREREVKGLLDKIQPDLITLDPSMVGKFDSAALSASGSSLVATAAQSLLDKSDKVKWGANVQVKNVGVDVPFSRMKRVERLAVQGKLDTTGAGDDSEDSDVEMKEGGDGDSDDEAGLSREEMSKKRKMRGKNKSLKRYLRKQRKNVVDPQVLAVRAKVDRMREEAKAKKLQMKAGGAGEENKRKSALDRFKAGSGK